MDKYTWIYKHQGDNLCAFWSIGYNWGETWNLLIFLIVSFKSQFHYRPIGIFCKTFTMKTMFEIDVIDNVQLPFQKVKLYYFSVYKPVPVTTE